MVDITQLEALARAATPGEWVQSERKPWLVVTDYALVAECFGNAPSGDITAAAYIAAANPSAILALIERVRVAEETLEFRDEQRGEG